MSFNIGLSGLYAANKQLDVTGNNIANAATTGFKSSRAEFADIYSANKLGTGSKTIGSGVNLAAVSQNFGQGAVNNTGNLLDMGIQGSGFFVLSDNGSLSYTRAGTFKSDKDGYVTSSDGTARLQGYGVDANGNIVNGVLTDLRIDTSNLAPKPTGSVTSEINLNSSSDAIDQTKVPFDPTVSTSYTKKFSTMVYDTQGNAHPMDQYMVKTGGNSWSVYTLIDGRNPDGSLPSGEGATPPVPSTMAFDSAGALTKVTQPDPLDDQAENTLVVTGWKPGAMINGEWKENGATSKAGGIVINMAKTTQYNTDSSRNPPTQDGYATGQINNLTIDGSGVMFANFSNNQSRAIGQISLASFTNEQGLQPVGGTAWKETYSSGMAGYDAPKIGSLGAIQSNSLEDSNVNLTSELVDLIKAQSNYQANAKTISTQSTIMQTIIQMT
ncbi:MULTISPECIES: flagellar hook protein FlgE [Pseudomonas]|uniref:Flagellar hook protein FlgE n=1 Tax=Pseudomonas psychrophila TaxID=122355 RepID=A0A8I1FMM3_9PSED|nr:MULTISPECIES: flagellar hook protein FlgE [Pseudomonas]EPJ95390.1 flagellar hook protein FlgE [Pseudomonas psychrophila]KOX66232.1 flagellar biosynthesis protein FlgE [Pseudomonas psychrophila]MBJ2255398.1 flagellar hook protein FlgE [Pseudomonas psychrophila]MDY7581726.1 flagellar hook protein FlgE [Pseudomonas sp. CCI3.1]MEB0070265.1 flagellar hook protein FlgE [Pseudomonas sp. CCI3.1]